MIGYRKRVIPWLLFTLSGCAPVFASEQLPVSLDSPLVFDTRNLDGEQVTEAVLTEKDITILNIWATFCNPCINEMPELAAWEQELPENVQLFYLCTDLSDMEDSTKGMVDMIADKSGINRKKVLLSTEEMSEELSAFFYVTPTTLFIDKEGNLYDKVVAGANIEQYKKTLQELLEDQE